MLVCGAVTWQRLLYSCLFCGCCLAAGLLATVYFNCTYIFIAVDVLMNDGRTTWQPCEVCVGGGMSHSELSNTCLSLLAEV
jgi:hypothetical protein